MINSMTRARLLATVALMALAQAATAAPLPLVTNGDFETGSLAGWTAPAYGTTNTTSNTGAFSAFTGCSAVGCVDVVAGGVVGTGAMTQTILNLTGGIYQLDYALKNQSSGVPNRFAGSLGTNVFRDQSDRLIDAAFVPSTVFSAVAGGNTTLSFAIRHFPSSMNIDSIALVMVDDGAGNNIAAVSLTVAAQNTYGFLDRLQNRFGHAGSPVQVALSPEVDVASSDGSGYISANGKYRAHMSGYGDRSKWDSGDVRSQRWGLSAGAEMAVASSLDLGFSLAAGHSRTASDTLFTDNRAEADEYLGAIYGHWSPGSLPLYLTAAAGYGYSSTDITRASLLGLGTVAARDVTTTQYLASLELGYDWKLSNTFILTPYARADGARVQQDGYTEVQLSGASLLPATVASADQDAARTILGARGTFDLNVGRRGAKLTANAGWAHEFERNRAVGFTNTSSDGNILTPDVIFAGIATGATPAADSVVAGANVEAPVTDAARIFAGYNGNFASGQDSHAAEVGLRVVW